MYPTSIVMRKGHFEVDVPWNAVILHLDGTKAQKGPARGCEFRGMRDDYVLFRYPGESVTYKFRSV